MIQIQTIETWNLSIIKVWKHITFKTFKSGGAQVPYTFRW